MTRRSQLFVLAALAIALAPLLLGAASWRTAPPQDAKVQGFRQEVMWNFAMLQYVNTRGELVEIPARRITRMILLAGAQDQLRLELLYENKDYSSIQVQEFHLIRVSTGLSAVDVPVLRERYSGMAFPAFQ